MPCGHFPTIGSGELSACGQGGVDDRPERVGVFGLVEASHVACAWWLGCDHAELLEYPQFAVYVAGVGSDTFGDLPLVEPAVLGLGSDPDGHR